MLGVVVELGDHVKSPRAVAQSAVVATHGFNPGCVALTAVTEGYEASPCKNVVTVLPVLE